MLGDGTLIASMDPDALDLRTFHLGIAPESCMLSPGNNRLWVLDAHGHDIPWEPSTSLVQARALVFDGLPAAGWAVEYHHRAPGHLLQYDGSCTAWQGLAHETVFWGGNLGKDTEALALTRLACTCAETQKTESSKR